MPAQRMEVSTVDPAAYAPMGAMEKYVHAGGLGEDVIALVKLRASQLNGCAFCLDMHAKEAREAGVEARKTDVLAGWHEATEVYSEREQAAIALTEEMTLIADGVTDETWDRAVAAFGTEKMPVLMMAICAINVWNRLAITTHQALPAA